jgi:uncharacterized protein HemX
MANNQELINFKSEIHEELRDFKETIHTEINDFKKYADASIEAKGTSIKTEAKFILALLILVLGGTITNMIQNSVVRIEHTYTKKVVERTVLQVFLNNLKQNKINAEFKKDTCEARKLESEIEKCREEIRKNGYFFIETTRGVLIIDQK